MHLEIGNNQHNDKYEFTETSAPAGVSVRGHEVRD